MKGRIRRLLLPVGAVAVAGVALGLGLTTSEALPMVEPHPLALPDPATTVALARTAEGALVLRDVDETGVVGVPVAGDLDPLAATEALGLAGLQALRDGGPAARYSLDDLQAPVDAVTLHIGAGNNFTEHQQETRVTDEPGLFPKLATPTAWNAEVPYVARLDYEAELCAVALAPIDRGGPRPLGFLLCNDFTDRLAMVRGFRPGGPLGTTGFADGKGAPGFLPTGPWLVVAEDPAAFSASVELRLSVDGRLRQQARESQAIWDHSQIVEAAFSRCGWDFRYHGDPVDWPACEQIPRGTLLLGGTPAGVIFRLTNLWAGWKYLDHGSVVVTEGTGLGRMVNRVGG